MEGYRPCCGHSSSVCSVSVRRSCQWRRWQVWLRLVAGNITGYVSDEEDISVINALTTSLLGLGVCAKVIPKDLELCHWYVNTQLISAMCDIEECKGWFCVLGWQAGVAGQSFSVGLQIQGLIVLNKASYIPQPWHSTLLAIATVLVGVVFNTFLARKLPLIEGIVMILHILGFFAILIPLWILAPKAPSSQVWSGLQNNAGWPTDGLAFMVGITSSVNALIGPDSAVHMSEEIRNASRVLPKAMIWTLVLNGGAGFIMSVTFAYCLGRSTDGCDPSPIPRQSSGDRDLFSMCGTFIIHSRDKLTLLPFCLRPTRSCPKAAILLCVCRHVLQRHPVTRRSYRHELHHHCFDSLQCYYQRRNWISTNVCLRP